MTSRYQGLFPPRPQAMGTRLLIIVVGAGSSRSTTNSNNNYLNLCMCSSLHFYSLSGNLVFVPRAQATVAQPYSGNEIGSPLFPLQTPFVFLFPVAFSR